MDSLGQVEASITADYPAAMVFNKNGIKHYVVYTPPILTAPITVTFSDGVSFPVNPDELYVYQAPAYVKVKTKIFLEGNFNTGTLLMDDFLRQAGNIPSEEPFSNLGYISVNQIVPEAIENPSTVFATTGNDAIIDWVWLELREENDASNVVATRAALLQADGDIVDLDGNSMVQFSGIPQGDYYLAIKHRTHLGIMTDAPVTLFPSATNYIDFTASFTNTYGNNAQKNENGTMLLWCGDSSADGLINALDRSDTWNFRNQSGYLNADVNLDGSCNAADRSITWNNRKLPSQAIFSNGG